MKDRTRISSFAQIRQATISVTTLMTLILALGFPNNAASQKTDKVVSVNCAAGDRDFEVELAPAEKIVEVTLNGCTCFASAPAAKTWLRTIAEDPEAAEIYLREGALTVVLGVGRYQVIVGAGKEAGGTLTLAPGEKQAHKAYCYTMGEIRVYLGKVGYTRTGQ